MSDAAEQIIRLQAQRGRPEPDRTIRDEVSAMAVEARRAQGRLGSFVDLWEGLVPADVASHTRVVAVRGGIAHVTVDTSSTAYEIDRLLREGLEHQLRRAYGKTLVRVKVTVGRFR